MKRSFTFTYIEVIPWNDVYCVKPPPDDHISTLYDKDFIL